MEKDTGLMQMNTNSHSTASATSSGVGYPFNNNLFPLASTWVDYCEKPDVPDYIRCVTELLDSTIKQSLPHGKFVGVLLGREAEVRQEAFLLLMHRYLAGNTRLIVATTERNFEAIENQIYRSIHAALWIAKRKLLRSLIHERDRYQFLETMDDTLVGCCLHPAEHKTLWDLPYDAQCALVVVSLRRAIADKLLPSKSATTALAMVEGKLNQSHVAKTLGVTRQAVHHQLQPVRAH